MRDYRSFQVRAFERHIKENGKLSNTKLVFDAVVILRGEYANLYELNAAIVKSIKEKIACNAISEVKDIKEVQEMEVFEYVGLIEREDMEEDAE